MITVSKIIITTFGIFLFGVGILMLFNPEKARATLRKAGSTNLINYTEITLRMIPAAAMILYSEYSKFPETFKLIGWFMIATSLILYIVPRKLHHNYSLKCADILKPKYFRMLSPLSMLFGMLIIYSVF